jgi:hypothetical protein
VPKILGYRDNEEITRNALDDRLRLGCQGRHLECLGQREGVLHGCSRSVRGLVDDEQLEAIRKPGERTYLQLKPKGGSEALDSATSSRRHMASCTLTAPCESVEIVLDF